MNRKERKYLYVVGALFAVLLLIELLKPTPVDWGETYTRQDKIPYGTYVLRAVLPDLLGQPVHDLEAPLYETLRRPTDRITYMFINSAADWDEIETALLLDWVREGNTAFIAAERFSEPLADSLGIRVAWGHAVWQTLETIRDLGAADSSTANFVNPALRAERPYAYYLHLAGDRYFAAFDTARTTVLGTGDRGVSNFIRMQIGQGTLLIHLIPLAFTNYHVLGTRNHEYAARALSYLPAQPVWWDEYYKAAWQQARTPLRYILRQPALRGAYWLALATAVLFVLVKGRRRQRPVPVVAPPRNRTLEFVQTVGRLYFLRGNHKHLAEKKIAYFRDYLRTRLNVAPHLEGEALHQRVAERTGVSRENVDALFAYLAQIQSTPTLSAETLSTLSHRLEQFYKQAKR